MICITHITKPDKGIIRQEDGKPISLMNIHAVISRSVEAPSVCALVSVQFSSVAQSCPTLCDPMNRSTPGLPVHHQLPSSLRLTSIESVMPSSHLILCRPLLFLPPIPPSIRVVSYESTLLMRWPKYWSSVLASFLQKKSQG